MAKTAKNKTKDKEVSNRDRLFLFELLANKKLNPESAAKKVGFADSVARTKAYLWVSNSKQNKKPHVYKLYQKLLKKRENKIDVTIQKIENEICKIAFTNIVDVINAMDSEINLSKLSSIDSFYQAAISEVTVIEFKGVVTTKLKMHSKLKAIELLGKRFKMWSDDAEKQKLIIEILNNGSPLKLR